MAFCTDSQDAASITDAPAWLEEAGGGEGPTQPSPSGKLARPGRDLFVSRLETKGPPGLAWEAQNMRTFACLLLRKKKHPPVGAKVAGEDKAWDTGSSKPHQPLKGPGPLSLSEAEPGLAPRAPESS